MGTNLQMPFAPLNSLGNYQIVLVCSRYQGQWLLSWHKERKGWETQGGHIEAGETPLEAAKRELYEESGVVEANIFPICDYKGFDSGIPVHGMVFYAEITEPGKLPESEIAETGLFSQLPENLSYPKITPLLLKYVSSEHL